MVDLATFERDDVRFAARAVDVDLQGVRDRASSLAKGCACVTADAWVCLAEIALKYPGYPRYSADSPGEPSSSCKRWERVW